MNEEEKSVVDNGNIINESNEEEKNEVNEVVKNVDDEKVEASKNVYEEVKQNDNNLNVYDEVVVKHKVYLENESCFDGKLIELIGYKILSFIITVFSLTLASAWGKCLVMSYKVNHTVINGKRLKFEGTGASLFVNRLKWGFFTVITLGIYAFWIPIKVKKWQLSNIHFEDEPHISVESFFDGRLIGLIGINFICRILNIFTLGLAYPFVVCIKLRWINKHSVINKKKLIFKGTAGSLFLHYLLWSFLTLITFGIYGLWLNIKIMKWQTKNTHIKRVDESYKKDKSILWLCLGAFVLIILCVSIVSNVLKNPEFKDKFGDIMSEINPNRNDEATVDQVDPINKNIRIVKSVRTYDDMILVFVENNNSFSVDIRARAEYKANGERVSTKNGYVYAITPGHETIVAINSPGKYYEDYEITIKASETKYTPKLSQVSYKVHNEYYVETDVNEEIDYAEIGMVYYNNGSIVGYSINGWGLAPNDSISGFHYDAPDSAFNSYKAYLVQAYDK